MELQKGICFLCRNAKVIESSQTEKAFKIFFSLFSKNILNITELKNVYSSLRVCPICYHKLMMLKHTNKNIETDVLKDEDDTCNQCLLCKRGKVLFKIKDWPHFNKISEDLVCKDKHANYVACSDCLFYLDVRNEIKTKLFSKYPKLKVKSGTKKENKRRKSKCLLDIKSQSTVHSEKGEKRAVTDVINISSGDDEEPLTRKAFNYDSLNKLKSLRHSKIFKRREIVKSDSKFLNQIPYVLLKASNFSNKHDNNKYNCNEIDDKVISVKNFHKKNNDVKNSKSRKCVSPEVDESTSKKKIKPIRLCPKSIKIKRTLRKHDILKDLIINLPKINTNCNSEREKFVFQSQSNVSTCRIEEEISKDSVHDLLKETETKVDVKTKRKSVSFAEEKNVEIEYFQNDSKTISNNDHFKKLIENKNDLESANKQDILETDAEDEKQNIKSTEENENEETYINNDITDREAISKAVIENKIGFDESPGMSDYDTINKDDELDDTPSKKKRSQILEVGIESTAKEQNKSVIEKVVTSKTEGTHKSKREKPKPLSKKKKKNSHINLENTTEDSSSSNISTKNVISENYTENISNISKCALSKTSKASDSDSDGADQTMSKDNKNSLSNEEIEVCNQTRLGDTDKIIDTDIDNKDKHNIDRVTEKDETDRNEIIKEKGSTNVDTKVDIEEREEDSSSKNEKSDKNECITRKKEDENTNSKSPKNESEIALEEEGTQLDNKDLKDIEDVETCEENKNRNNSKSEDIQRNVDEELDKVYIDLNDENKESNEELTGDGKTVNDPSKKIENADSNSFSGSDKNDELGISEDDQNNINSILTDMFPKKDLSGNETVDEWKTTEKDSGDDMNSKRKMSDDELNSPDKKKKKVTFCEDFT